MPVQSPGAEPGLPVPRWPDDHHLGGFDEGGSHIACSQLKLAAGVASNDRSHSLATYVKSDFGEEADDLNRCDPAHQLVAATDEALQAAT
jgi:hypothetical protein